MFAKVAYKAIKEIFDSHEGGSGVGYGKGTIVNAFDLKSKLERLNLKQSRCTIFSLDIQDFYPSITFDLVKKAILFYQNQVHLDDDKKRIVDMSLEMIEHSMKKQFFTFHDKYYHYSGQHVMDSPSLTIGGYESAWLADLTASYLLDATENHFIGMHYKGIYRDDGIVIYNSKLQNESRAVAAWLKDFQDQVDALCTNDDGDKIANVVFTAEIWKPPSLLHQEPIDPTSTTKVNDFCTELHSPYFPYLDMKLEWPYEPTDPISGTSTLIQDGLLEFTVHLKPNQQLLYLDRGSTHRETTFEAIPQGVFHRLASLTSDTDKYNTLQIDALYPEHATALRAAKLAPPHFPTVGAVRAATQAATAARKTRRKNKSKRDDRTVYICVGESKYWIKPIHVIVKNLLRQYNLPWLIYRMSYHRFPNLSEHLQGILTAKLMKPVSSATDPDFKECNCMNGICQLHGAEGRCNTRNVIYQITCKICNDAYIGNTSTPLKSRISNHISEVRRCIRCPPTPVDPQPPGDPPDQQVVLPHSQGASTAGPEASPPGTLPHLQDLSTQRSALPHSQEASTPPHLQDPGGNRRGGLRRRITDNAGWRKSSTTFATHMAKCWKKTYPDKPNPTPSEIRSQCEISILWKASTLSCNKSFTDWDCRLCQQERVTIFKLQHLTGRRNFRHIINKSNEMFGTCKHRPKFHRLIATI